MKVDPEKDDWESNPPRNVWRMMPKKTLVKAVWLLVMLAGVFWFQGRSASCARTYTEQVMPPPSPRRSTPNDDRNRVIRMADPPAGKQDTVAPQP